MTHDTRMEGETGQQGISNDVEVPMMFTEGCNKGQFPSDQQEHGTMLMPRSLSLPSPVPCTGSVPPDSNNSTVKALSLPHQSSQNNPAVNRYYPHLDLPCTPEYFFSDEIVFTPNPELLAKIVEIGFTEMVATKALYWTGNSCTEVALNWIFERNEKTLNTPLEIEVKMLKADLDMKNEESRERIRSIDSGICMDDDDTDISIDSDDLDVYKLVLVVNKSFRFSPEVITELVGGATGHIVAKVGMLAEGDIQLEMWETCGEQVMVYKGENTRHLLDIRLSAQCLGVEWVEEGRYWDRVNRIYREVAVLGIWGLVDSVEVLVGRLERMVQTDAGSM